MLTRHVLTGQIPPPSSSPLSWTTIVQSIISIQVTCERLWPRNKFSLYVNCDLDLGDMTWSESHDTIVFNIIQIKHDSKELWVWHRFRLCVYFDPDLRNMTLDQCHDTPLGLWQQLCEILSRSNMTVKSYGPDTDFEICVHSDLDLGDMNLGQGHDTP